MLFKGFGKKDNNQQIFFLIEEKNYVPVRQHVTWKLVQAD